MSYVREHTKHAQLNVPEFFVVCPLPEPNCGTNTSEQFIVEGDHSVGCTLNLPLSHLQGKDGDLGRKNQPRNSSKLHKKKKEYQSNSETAKKLGNRMHRKWVYTIYAVFMHIAQDEEAFRLKFIIKTINVV